MLNFFGKSKKGKKKKYEDYDDEEYDEDYEDDEYDDDDDYEDDYDDDDEDDDYDEAPKRFPFKKKEKVVQSAPKKKRPVRVETDELDELQEENDLLQEEVRQLKAELRKSQRAAAKVESEVAELKEENESLENELATVQAVPKDYEARLVELQQLQRQYDDLSRDHTRQTDELDLNRKKAERFSQKIRQYEQELLSKQDEIDKLSEDRIVIMASDPVNTDTGTYEELSRVRQELEAAKRRLAQQELSNETKLSKEDIGEVLLEAKRQAKEIINQANHRAQLVNEEVQRKAAILKRLERAEKEYTNYYNRIKNVKEESELVFNQIIDLVKDDQMDI